MPIQFRRLVHVKPGPTGPQPDLMMDISTPTAGFYDQIQLISLALGDLESDFRFAESMVEFELLMIALSKIRKALEDLI